MSSRKTKEDMDDAIAKWAGKDEVALSLEAKRAAASPRVPKLKEVKVESAVSAWLGDGEKGADKRPKSARGERPKRSGPQMTSLPSFSKDDIQQPQPDLSQSSGREPSTAEPVSPGWQGPKKRQPRVAGSAIFKEQNRTRKQGGSVLNLHTARSSLSDAPLPPPLSPNVGVIRRSTPISPTTSPTNFDSSGSFIAGDEYSPVQTPDSPVRKPLLSPDPGMLYSPLPGTLNQPMSWADQQQLLQPLNHESKSDEDRAKEGADDDKRSEECVSPNEETNGTEDAKKEEEERREEKEKGEEGRRGEETDEQGGAETEKRKKSETTTIDTTKCQESSGQEYLPSPRARGTRGERGFQIGGRCKENAPTVKSWCKSQDGSETCGGGGGGDDRRENFSTRMRNKTMLVEEMGVWMTDRSAITGVMEGKSPQTQSPSSTVGGHERKKRVLKSKATKLMKGKQQHKETIFEQSLNELFMASGSPIPLFVVQCIKYFKTSGALKQEGVFRVSGSRDAVAGLKAHFQIATDLLDLDELTDDPNAVASLLKSFYRDLPEPIMTHSLSYEAYENFQTQMESEGRIEQVREMIGKLPLLNAINLRFLIEFLNTILIYSERNKMTSENLAIVWGPNLFRVSQEKDSMNVVASQFDKVVTEFLIEHYEKIFEGVATQKLEDPNKRKGNSIKSSERGKSFVVEYAHSAMLDKELSFGIGDELVLLGPGPSEGTFLARNSSNEAEGLVSCSVVPANLVQRFALEAKTQDVVTWPFCPHSGTVQRKMVVKKDRTVNEVLKSVAIKMAADRSELQLVRITVEPIEDSANMLEVLAKNENIGIMWNGKLSDTVTIPPKKE